MKLEKICKKFSNINIFQLIFWKIFIIAISAIITTNILKYIKKPLNLKMLVCLYQKLLDYLNIIYIITSIISSNFENLHFLILPKIYNISNIKKTIIFINSIEKI